MSSARARGEPPRHGTSTLARVLAVAVVACGATGYLAGHGRGADLEAARVAGTRQGVAEARRHAADAGYRAGYRAGLVSGARRTYKHAYFHAYREAFRRAGLPAPAEIVLPVRPAR
jgi:hypothetical protein